MSEPIDDPEYQKLVEELAKECKCLPVSNRPCDGLLAGGLCDKMGHRDVTDWQEDLDE